MEPIPVAELKTLIGARLNGKKGPPVSIEPALIAIALAPHLQPSFYTSVLHEFMPQGGEFPEFGGVKGQNHRGLLPTGETAQFILGGMDFKKRMKVATLLSDDSPLVKEGILRLQSAPEGEPRMSGKLILSQDYVDYFLTGEPSKPKFSPAFPAREITTELKWKDVVLPEAIMHKIEEVRIWLAHNKVLTSNWKVSKKPRPGYLALFHGPPGTGKTLTATLLGKYTGKPVYQIDLNTVVSKYIGETEKNLHRLFQKVRNRNWILFFDEADAIFGKRVEIKNAHDRYANQEVSYLLQLIVDFEGLVILSSNSVANIDKIFLRRFDTVIEFPFPKKEDREKIAKKAFPKKVKFEKNINIPALISNYELSSGNIVNIVRYAYLKSISKNRGHIDKSDVLDGIMREMEKVDKVFSD